ncbi:battenin CLN3 protein [Malassezia yamatoensis]|uniref:Protein BTN n=1 Tax=Malassezia yamatoensis TaxID=253288 RepID=A0AAJ6CID7_9BASI|nr:battenin CLN3 protein [Malassezia yamatoensis]
MAYFFLGLLNNLPYVVILTAALELLPSDTPTGVIAFVNIFPALIAKAYFPYLLKGEIRYKKRVLLCVGGAFGGMLTTALSTSLYLRLVGVAIASFVSGLGEITYLQSTTRYPSKMTERCVGWFSSGTGAAGLAGASAWWFVRPLGVRSGLSLLSFLPFGMALAFLSLPDNRSTVRTSMTSDETSETLLNHEADSNQVSQQGNGLVREELSLSQKLHLLQPLIFPFILPLVLVYFAEYTINQGIAPTLLYPVPSPKENPLLAKVIYSLRDYYPLYQLTYQTFVFLSRSYTSLLHLPPIPRAWLWLPAIVQFVLMATLSSESLYNWLRESLARPVVIVLIAIEGLAGGSAYVSVMSSIGTLERQNGAMQHQPTRLQAQEYEFKIGCVGVSYYF